MKPLKLSLQAFGPFSGNEEIDFTKLGSNPLFLINGPTGAGKSSILDAICFALYGQTTGAERDAAQMRCDHADLSVLTEVSLEFSLGDKRYLIRRVPFQQRAKSRGEGTTTQTPEAQLRALDGSEDGRLLVSKSVSEATTHVKQLMGLDVEQFRQVMVLPQGKFRELLMADSKEREKIFGQLFQTNVYRRIEERLKTQAAAIKQAVVGHHNEIRGILQAAEVNSEQDITQEVEALKPMIAEAQIQKQSAADEQRVAMKNRDQGAALKSRFNELTAKRDAFNAIVASAPEFETKQWRLDQAVQAQKIQHLYDAKIASAAQTRRLSAEKSEGENHLMTASAAYEHAQLEYSKAKLAFDGLDDLKIQKADLQRYEGFLLELSNVDATQKTLKTAADSSRSALKKEQLKQHDLQAEQVKNQQIANDLALELEALPTHQAALESLQHKFELRQQLETLRQKAAELSAQVKSAQENLQHQTQVHENSVASANVLELRWHTGQAALLAKELQLGDPCPVCGSAEHPHPAVPLGEDQLISKSQVDAARSLQQQALDQLHAHKEAFDRVNNQKQLNTHEGQRLKAGIAEYADKEVDAMAVELTAAQNSVELLKSKQTEQQQLNRRAVEIQKVLESSVGVLSELEKTAQENELALSRTMAAVEQLQQQIPQAYRPSGFLENALNQLGDKIRTITQAAEAAERTLTEQQSIMDKTESSLSALNKQCEEAQVKENQTLQVWSSALKTSGFSDETLFNQALLDDAQQQDLKSSIDRYNSQVDSSKAVIEQMECELADHTLPDTELLEAKLLSKVAMFEQTDAAWLRLSERGNLLGSVQEKLKKSHVKNEVLEQQYAVMGTLSDVANGQTGDKISLNRFVLSVLLDDVLIQASHRLHIMSKGRYRLVRKEDRAKGNKASGLELEVEDGNTGKTRAVATLSGGESFMAALSLALGLSDVVQSYAGGIKLDALFIDEGFGSLDTESLDAAVRVLMDLQASGRMIGIISHVSELKEQMALRVDVNSGQTGSHISLRIAS